MESSQVQREMREWRRHLHMHPELSAQETRTTAFLEERLLAFGLLPRRLAPTGVVADIGQGGPLIALRADIDALPIVEDSLAPYASRTPGVMHACGHDAHTAMLLGVAKRLGEHPPRSGRVRLLFQAAEEVPPGGALALVEAGVLEDVTMIFGIHVQSGLPVGTAAIGPGPVTANSDRFEIVLHGAAGHAAMPHEAKDAIVMAGHLIVALQTIVARSVDPLAPAAVSIGRLDAGYAANVVADRARLLGTVRSLDSATRDLIEERLGTLARTTAGAFGGTAELHYARGYPSVENAPEPSRLFAQAARDVLGAEHVRGALTQLAGEDFGHYTHEVPGAFLNLGSGRPDRDFPHHHPRFDIDEGALELGVRIWLRLVDLALAHLAASPSVP